MIRRRVRWSAVLLVLVLGAGGLPAQERAAPAAAAPPAAAPEPAPEAIPAAAVTARAEELLARLRGLDAQLVPDDRIEAIARRLPASAGAVAALAGETGRLLAGEATLRALETQQLAWRAPADQLAGWTATLSTDATTVDRGLLEVTRLTQTWTVTRDAAVADALPPATLERIGAVLAAIDAAGQKLRQRREYVLTLQARVSDLQAQAAEQVRTLDAAATALRRNLLARQAPPLWHALREPGTEPPVARQIRDEFTTTVRDVRSFLVTHQERVAWHLLATLMVLALVLTLRRRSAGWSRTEPAVEPVRRLVARPLAATLLLAVFLMPLFYVSLPGAARRLVGVAALGPITLILETGASRRVRGVVAPLLGLFTLGLLRDLVPTFAVPARVLLVAQAVLGALWLFRRFRPARLAHLGASPGSIRPLAALGYAAGATLLAAAVADVTGAMALAVLLAEGIFFAIYVALALHATRLVLDGLVVGILGMPSMRRLHTVQRHAPGIQRRTLRVLHGLLLTIWVAALLGGFSLLDPVTRAVETALAAPLAVGEVGFSLGAIVSFVLTLTVVVVVSRIVRTVLDEDVLGRLDLPQGVPAAISAGVTYLFVLGGFLFATAAAGFGMERVALIVSALGVGIGFGLQTVVNNFVSGLILLFERPIRAGDVVDVGNLTGEVVRIGIRASTVRTFDGAEVIVPNGMLLADKVVNWTLSDRRRRVDIPVGVAYGSKPREVVALLEATARAHASVLDLPPPQALFLAFGPSSMDFVLRAWTLRADHAVVRSELVIAVAEALEAAGIAVPFPQQDLHVRSVAPDVVAALRAADATSRPAD